MSIWVKYGPLRQMTDYWAGIRPKQLITLFYGHENLSHVISYFDVMAKTADMGEYPVTVEMAYEVQDADISEMHISVNVKELAAALERIEPERGGFVELTPGDKNFTPSAQFKSPVDSLLVGYEKIRRYEPDHGAIVEYTHANDFLRTNAQKGLLMLRKGDMALHVKPAKWGDMEEYMALGGVLYGSTFKPALSYNEEEMHMTVSRRRRNPAAAEPDGVVDETPAGPLADVTVEIDDLDVTLDPSMMVVTEDEGTAPTDEIPEDSYEPSVQSISIDDNSDLDAALSGAIVAPDEPLVEDIESGDPVVEVTDDAMPTPAENPEMVVDPQLIDTPAEVPPTEPDDGDTEESEFTLEDAVDAALNASEDLPNRWKCKANTRNNVIEDLRDHGWLVVEPENLTKCLTATDGGCVECPDEAPMPKSASVRLVAVVNELMKLVDEVQTLEEAPVVEQVDPVDAAIALLTSMKGDKR